VEARSDRILGSTALAVGAGEIMARPGCDDRSG
jgi:hypothetical protein